MEGTLSKRTLRGNASLQSVWELSLREPQLILTILLVLFMTLVTPRFLTAHNLLMVLRQSSINGIVTCGVCWMMISGSFDLSIGSLVSLISVAAVALLQEGSGVVEPIVVGLAMGVAAGLVNGFLVGRLKANAMLVTLGTLTVFQGFALLTTGGQYFRMPLETPFRLIADGFVGPIAVPIVIFLSVAFIMHLILSQTPFGLRIYAIGGNEEAAQLAGLNVARYRILMYVATGVTSAIAAMVVSARAGSGHHFMGLNYEFNAITASILGGNYIYGGRGSVVRGVWGALLLAVLANAQTHLGIDPRMQMVVQGVVTVAIVSVQVFSTRKES